MIDAFCAWYQKEYGRDPADGGEHAQVWLRVWTASWKACEEGNK